MVRVGGLQFTCAPAQKIGKRIGHMTLKGKPIDAQKTYKVASWAPVTEGVSGEPVWDVVVKYLRDRKVIRPPQLNRPRLVGVKGNPGIA